jgi:UDP-2,3-diacylglucosamine pyrophosphatase LpxH
LNHARIHGHPNPRRYRTIWLSDVHLGTRACRADLLLDFLRHHDADVIYLVGDIVDGWQLTKSWYWPQSHNDVVQKILRKVRKGSSVVYIPGNHDAAARGFAELHFGGVLVQHDALHRTADGKTLWVVHGDAFDSAVRFPRLLAWLGGWAYDAATALNVLGDGLRDRLGRPHWSLAAEVKRRSRRVAAYVEAYQQAAVTEARRRGADGIVCGHIHTPALKTVDGILYCNDGDWVENCSALVEHVDGRLETVQWLKARATATVAAPLSAPLPLPVHASVPAAPLVPTGVSS